MKLRSALRDQQQAGTLPPELQGVDIRTVDLRGLDLQVKVSADDQFRMQTALWLTDFGPILAVLVVAVCLGIAALTRPARQTH